MNGTGNSAVKKKRNPQEWAFIVNESYAGKRNLTDIFADLLYSVHQKQEPEITGDVINHDGYLPDRTGLNNYAGV
jgi:hypothetical protein